MKLLELPVTLGSFAKRLEPATRRLAIPVLAALAVAASGYVLYRTLADFEDLEMDRAMQAKVVQLRGDASQEIAGRIQALENFARRWQSVRNPGRDAWIHEAEQLMDHRLQFRAIEWRDSSLSVRWIAPSSANLPGLALDPNGDEVRSRELVGNTDRDQGEVTRSIRLPNGERQILVSAPMSAEGRRTGFMVGVIRMKDLMDAIADPDIARGYVVTLYEGPLLIFGPNRDDDWDHSQWAADAEFQTDDLSLRIQVWPSGELERSLRSRGPVAILALGLSLALLMGVLLYRMRGWKTRALAAEAALAAGVGAASVTSGPYVTGVPPITSSEPPAC